MSQTYYAILTAVGEAKLANATALGVPLQISRMAAGDGNGALPNPDRLQTALVHENYRADLNSLIVDPVNTSQIIAELVIPEASGGWWIREMGLYDATGALVAVCNCPPSYKPQLAEGSGKTQVLRMVLVVSSTAAVELKVDPSVVLATRAYADAIMVNHLAAVDPHPQYTTEPEVSALIAASMNSLDSKQSALYTTTGNINLSGLATQAGGDWVAALTAGERVLVKDQATAKDNGLYHAGSGAWARAADADADADASAEVTPGMLVTVEAGATLADTVWELTTNGPIVLGTTALTFELTAAMTATQVDAEAGTNNVRRMTPLRVAQAINALFPKSTDGIAGSFSNLKASATGANSSVTVTADSVCVKNASGQQKVLNGVALAINSAATGANGLDTGVLAVSSWYSMWVIYNPATQVVAGLLSLNATAPVMPAGYTHKARVGWARTDGTANKYPLSFVQNGRRWQYKVVAGSNVGNMPIMANGVSGSVSTPTYSAISVSAFVPTTAAEINLVLAQNASGATLIAPNGAYGANGSMANPPYAAFVGNPGNSTNFNVSMVLESANIYYASGIAGAAMACTGFVDNL